ncbi:MAG: AAA family ATPase, partial [Burkholderiales bacterium]|nr:AAA family ATPase [Burkholderiales bacterium]
MYLDHFGLKTAPFSITPASRFFYSGAGRGKVLDALLYAASRGDGLIKVTSEVGSGKTMLCRMMIEQLPSWLESIYLPNPAASREELISAVADELGISTSGLLPPRILKAVQDRLIEKYAKGVRVVVILDEAHAMPCEALEELRLLYNLESGSE